jgi:putative aminopeptidase FrvX
MDRKAHELLKNIFDCPSPSGCEQKIQSIVRDHLEGEVDEIRTDVHGNVIAVQNPDAPLRVMIAGHCDEIGLMVTHIDEQGFLYFLPMAWWDPVVLGAQWVEIHNERGVVPGVIPRKAIHHQEEEDYTQFPKTKLNSDFWIDIGATSKEDALKAVAIGDTITICREFRQLRNNMFTARGIDDRAGMWVMAETMRRIKKMKLQCAVYGVSTVQEEIGMRGATSSAFDIDAHVGIVVEVGCASDSPKMDKRVTGECAVGQGPIMFRGANINPKLMQIMERAAKRKRIRFQIQPLVFPLASGTDAFEMQITLAGMATTIVSLPTRYLHSSVEVASLKDLDRAVAIIAATLEDLKPGIDFTP